MAERWHDKGEERRRHELDARAREGATRIGREGRWCLGVLRGTYREPGEHWGGGNGQ
jgi:hypothetical protein